MTRHDGPKHKLLKQGRLAMNASRIWNPWDDLIVPALLPPLCPCCQRALPSFQNNALTRQSESQVAPEASQGHLKAAMTVLKSLLPIPAQTDLCADCRRRLPFIKENYCLQCGARIEKGEEYCAECQETPHSFEEARALFSYSQEVSSMILAFKNKGERSTGEWLGKEMGVAFRETIALWKITRVIPIPLLPSKKKERGYNQAEILASHIAKENGNLLLDTTSLIRIRKAKEQKTLGAKERLLNLLDVFAVQSSFSRAEHILLVDDVLTTGSTLDVCARLLLEAGAGAVYALVAARA